MTPCFKQLKRQTPGVEIINATVAGGGGSAARPVLQARLAGGNPPQKPGWTTDPSVLFSINNWLGNIFPPVKDMSIQLGIPIALIPVVIAAAWQLTGFSMAMYIAGMAKISAELREAARIVVAKLA